MEDKKCGGKTEIYLGQSREGRVRHQKTESKTIRTDQKRKKKTKKKRIRQGFIRTKQHILSSLLSLSIPPFLFSIYQVL